MTTNVELGDETISSNGSPASRASLQVVSAQVTNVSNKLNQLSDALVGVPNISKGALQEFREGIAQTHVELGEFKTGFTQAVIAVINQQRLVDQANDKRARKTLAAGMIQGIPAAIVAGAMGLAAYAHVFGIGLSQVH
jgi:hypothetical protein